MNDIIGNVKYMIFGRFSFVFVCVSYCVCFIFIYISHYSSHDKLCKYKYKMCGDTYYNSWYSGIWFAIQFRQRSCTSIYRGDKSSVIDSINYKILVVRVSEYQSFDCKTIINMMFMLNKFPMYVVYEYEKV